MVWNAFCRAFDELSGRKVAEVVRGQIRQQRKSHVGRRRAVRHHGNGMLLIVIRRQPMILRADESLEECPGFPGNLPQKEDLICCQSFSAASKRPTDPPGDSGGDKPETQYGPGHGQRGRLGCGERDRRRPRQRTGRSTWSDTSRRGQCG